MCFLLFFDKCWDHFGTHFGANIGSKRGLKICIISGALLPRLMRVQMERKREINESGKKGIGAGNICPRRKGGIYDLDGGLYFKMHI